MCKAGKCGKSGIMTRDVKTGAKVCKAGKCGKSGIMTRDVKTQSFTAIRFFHYFNFSLRTEAPKLLHTFVPIFRRNI